MIEKKEFNDSLIDCPCCAQRMCCYSTKINEFHNSYWCLGCGFVSNDLLKHGEYDADTYESQLPELYKDVKTIDKDNRVWYPSTVNLEEKGTVFLNGTCKDDIRWSAIKSVLLTEEEKKKPIFKNKTHKSNPETLKDFGGDYLSALEYIGVL